MHILQELPEAGGFRSGRLKVGFNYYDLIWYDVQCKYHQMPPFILTAIYGASGISTETKEEELYSIDDNHIQYIWHTHSNQSLILFDINNSIRCICMCEARAISDPMENSLHPNVPGCTFLDEIGY